MSKTNTVQNKTEQFCQEVAFQEYLGKLNYHSTDEFTDNEQGQGHTVTKKNVYIYNQMYFCQAVAIYDSNIQETEVGW